MAWENDRSRQLYDRNADWIAGGVVSLNRKTDPMICFRRGEGCRVWDEDGNGYIDYHAGFAPVLLGHNHPKVDEAVRAMMASKAVHMGSGTTWFEGRLAELLVQHIPALERVQIANTGSEATALAIRLARAHTGRDDVIVMQGGYNGWHDDVGHNCMTPVEVLGPRVSPGAYPTVPLGAGTPKHVQDRVHAVNFNDLDSVRHVCEQHEVAALITEPILQNIGVVMPQPGYLEGLRALADAFGFVLIFDEVKTGFRHGLGGYQGVCGVTADLSTWAKAAANGYPISVLGGRRDLMDLVEDPDPARRVMIAGTYNAHPVPVAAAIATIELLAADDGAIYRHLYAMGERLERGLNQIFADTGTTATMARQGSAFCTYFMDHAPVDWHDVAEHHDFDRDAAYRHALLKEGIYHFPLPTKQGSISASHREVDIDETLEITERVVRHL